MAHTHRLTIDGPLLTKRYTSWERGEPGREWEVLQLVHGHAPDLVPRPIQADLDSRPPAVTMTVIPGNELVAPLDSGQLEALGDAIETLWAVPHKGFAASQPWTDDLAYARRLVDGKRPEMVATRAAYDAAVAWWHGPDPALLMAAPASTVLGHRDPNLSNYLWDGHRVRIVDFEDSAVSDSANELAILTEHLACREVDADRLQTRFRVDQARLRAARRLWAMFWLWLLLPGGSSAARNPPGTAQRQADRLLRLLADA